MANPATPPAPPTAPNPAAPPKTRRSRALPFANPDAESDPKRREIMLRAQRVVDELRQYDTARAQIARKQHDRKAMILGRHFLGVMDRDESFAKATVASLDRELHDKTERELFGLPPTH